MTDNKKEVERAELHRTIWAIADEMRGSVDGWDFKSYILGILFYRYARENRHCEAQCRIAGDCVTGECSAG